MEYSTTTDPRKVETAVKYCSDLVRKQDYDNYLCIPFYPSSVRNAQYAIRALNIELAGIRESVSNTIIGQMRMQFWRDTIDKVYKGTPPSQPIAIALAEALKTCSFSSMWIKRLIDEREANLQDPQYMTIKDLETYAENTASQVLYLQLESLGVRDVQADHAVSHIGKAIGITTLLRAMPFHASHRRMILPAEITAKYNVPQEEVFRTGHAGGLEDAVFEVATAAHDHMLTARSLVKSVPKEVMPVLLSAIPCDDYLKALEKAQFNSFDPKVQIRDWKLPYRLWRKFRTGQI
ncbi:hypothetical protein BZG36_02942 [Bifiguratus adelaidae]|uniref:NADH dehydrogenase (Ubiquinone) complex I, assembly factor 6 n=1 Tax=Bifiguratus adelaidae TaxID=1938954 RepID=A0A261Y032_9FUNG|nr:hypothetical protein BZG36_02942 [Bifiguratus adelaidae]